MAGKPFGSSVSNSRSLEAMIVLDRRMVIHVVAAEIGEGGGRTASRRPGARWSRPWLEASIAACVTPASASFREQLHAATPDRASSASRTRCGRARRRRSCRSSPAAWPACAQIWRVKAATEVLPAGAGDGDHRLRLAAMRSGRRQAPGNVRGSAAKKSREQPASIGASGRNDDGGLRRGKPHRQRIGAEPSALVPERATNRSPGFTCRLNRWRCRSPVDRRRRRPGRWFQGPARSLSFIDLLSLLTNGRAVSLPNRRPKKSSPFSRTQASCSTRPHRNLGFTPSIGAAAAADDLAHHRGGVEAGGAPPALAFPAAARR
jgi:hypothetical protein